MSQSIDPNTAKPQAPFQGQPFGSLAREDHRGDAFGIAEPLEDGAADEPSRRAALDDAGGFDFHLGVYARF